MNKRTVFVHPYGLPESDDLAQRKELHYVVPSWKTDDVLAVLTIINIKTGETHGISVNYNCSSELVKTDHINDMMKMVRTFRENRTKEEVLAFFGLKDE